MSQVSRVGRYLHSFAFKNRKTNEKTYHIVANEEAEVQGSNDEWILISPTNHTFCRSTKQTNNHKTTSLCIKQSK
jgi:hypothetical protein